jgi:hypothetical protein
MTFTPNFGASADDIRTEWIAGWLALVCAP